MALTDNKAKIQALIAGINALPEAGSGEAPDPVLQEKTVSPSTDDQEVTPDGGYDGLSKVTVNAMPTASQAVPVIDVDDDGLITATAQQQAGYVAAGSESATKQLPTQAAQTITPGTADQTIAARKYLVGDQIIKGEANLVPVNIAKGVSIFGVAGSLEAGSGGGSGGLQITTGVSEIAYSHYDHIITGLGFRPRLVMILSTGEGVATATSYFYMTSLLWCDDENNSMDIVAYERGSTAGVQIATATATEKGFSVNDDGFTFVVGSTISGSYTLRGNLKIQYFAATW